MLSATEHKYENWLYNVSFLLFLDAQRKLGFLDQEGFDVFGNNALFTPLVKWETLQDDVNEIKAAAETYEQAFNDMMEEETNNENFREVSHQ